MITVHIYIMGLIALLPTYNSTGLSIVVPAVEGHVPHVPVIVFPAKPKTYIAETHEAACALDLIGNIDDNGLLDNGCQGCGALVLNGEVLGIKGLTLGSLKFANGRRDSVLDIFGAGPKSPTEARDFSWIPKMDDLAGHSSPMKDYYYDPDYCGPKRAALLNLEGVKGSVWVSHIAETMEPSNGCKGTVGEGDWPNLVSCEEKAKPEALTTRIFPATDLAYVRPLSFVHHGFPIGYPRQAVGDQVTIELTAESSTVTLSRKGHDDIILAPRDGKIDILIANVTPLANYGEYDKCPCEVIKTWPKTELNSECHIEVGHFRYYYEMSSEAGPAQKISFGLDWRRNLASKLKQSKQPGVVKAISLPWRYKNIHGGVGRPICTPMQYGGS